MLNKKNRGFTLVELMIVVAIIGIISAIAIPAVSKYIKKSRTAEVPGFLDRQWAGSVTYYMTDFSGGTTGVLPRQFPGPTGSWEVGEADVGDCCAMPNGRCPGNASVWMTDGVWLALKFTIPDEHSYMPGYTGLNSGTSAQFTAYARGNLNCDAVFAEFYRPGGVSSNGDVTGARQPYVVNELE